MDTLTWMKAFGSPLSIFLSIIIFFDKIVIPLYINWKKDKRLTLRTQKLQLNSVGNNPATVKPGDGEACKKNREAIVTLETKLKEACKDITEIKENNREDHKDMFDKIDKIRDKRR